MNSVPIHVSALNSWKEVGLKIGAWGLLLATFLLVFMGLPLLALSF